MTLIGIFLSLVPGALWLMFYLEEDEHPEPAGLIFQTFLVGGLFAFVALAAELVTSPILSGIGIPTLSIFSILIFAGIEEIVKFWAAWASIHKNPAFDEPVDAMIYMVVASLGFATVENLGAIHSGIFHLNTAFETATLRFLGATLLHSLTSGLVGYYWAWSIREMNSKKFIIKGLCIATALHAIFNLLILNYGDIIYSVIFVTIVGMFVLNDFEKLKDKKV